VLIMRLWLAMIWNSRSTADGEDRAAGFTLVEVIAALAILSLTMATIFGILSNSFFNQRKARDLAEATSLAQSTLARIGTEWALAPTTLADKTDPRYRWEARITPYTAQPVRGTSPIVPYNVEVRVFVDGSPDPLIVLSTVRLGAPVSPQ
jgi:general secretion pathway protein I